MSCVLSTDQIRTDGGTQPRDHISDDVVKRYIEDMTGGAEFPPVAVFFDGAEYWLADGYHRVTACRCLEKSEIVAAVHQGTRRDAVLYSVGANATHGYPRSNADKRRAVLTLLKDSEWSQWADRAIARRCGVGAPFVASVRATICNPITDTPRTVQRGSTTYEMNTGSIGGRAVEFLDNPATWETADKYRRLNDGELTPAFPPEHAPVSGRIAWLMSELAKSLTINPTEFTKANSWSRQDIGDYARLIVAWASELEQELEDEAA